MSAAGVVRDPGAPAAPRARRRPSAPTSAAHTDAGLAALLSAVSYAEMAGLVPAAGSSYSYTYATMGEGMAWICG